MSRPGTTGAPAGAGTLHAATPRERGPVPPPAPKRVRVPRLSGSAWVVAVAGALSAVTAVLLAKHLFPFLSIDNDEPLYRLQAQALAHGHLFPPATAPAASYTPWLAVVHGGHYVLKYTPVVPALYALSLLATGGTVGALAVLAFALVVVTYLLGLEVVGDRRTAALAAVLVACSPLVVVQSALLLPYLPAVVLLELTAFGLLRGVSQGRRGLLVVAGFAFGLAAVTRPFDAALVTLPVAGWAFATARGRRRRLVGWCALGAVLPAAALLAFDAAATGHALRLPFALLEPKDMLGFGRRKLFPSDPAHDFGLAQGWHGVGSHLWLLVTGWSFGGPLLALAAVGAAVRRRVGAPALALLAGPALLTVGYLGFWGAWNAATLWGGIRYVGPFYLMPWVVPLALVGAAGLVDLVRWRPAAGVAALGACAALSAVVLAVALPADATFTRNDRRLHSLVTARSPRPVVFVSSDPPFLGHPSAVMSNPVGMDGQVLWAVSRGADDFAVLARHPDRPAYLLRVAGNYNRTPHARGYVQLERLGFVRGADVRLALSVRPAHSYAGLRLVVICRGTRRSYDLDPRTASRGTLVVTAAGASVDGLGRPQVTRSAAGAAGAVQVSLLAVASAGSAERSADRQRLPMRPSGAGVEILAPVRQVALYGTGAPPALQVLATTGSPSA